MVLAPLAVMTLSPENPRLIQWLGLLVSVLDPSKSLDDRLIVDGNRDGSRSVRSDDGGGELLMAELIVPYLRVGSLLVSVISSSKLWMGSVMRSLSMCTMPIPA